MKTKMLLSFVLLGFTLTVLKAQTAPVAPATTTAPVVPIAPDKPKGYNKGHFVFGTNLVNYTNSAYTEIDKVNTVARDTVKTSFSNFSFSFNVWGGYFISDKLCVGLNFNETYGNSAPAGYPFYYYGAYGNYGIFSALVPTDLFFRYYIVGDTGLVNVFVEGIVGASFSSGTYVLYGQNGSYQTQTLPTTETSFNADLNVALSLNASKHFAVQFKAGLVFNGEDYNFATGTVKGNGTTTTTNPSESAFSSVGFVGTLALQYKL